MGRQPNVAWNNVLHFTQQKLAHNVREYRGASPPASSSTSEMTLMHECDSSVSEHLNIVRKPCNLARDTERGGGIPVVLRRSLLIG
jgi:hypothetical protein